MNLVIVESPSKAKTIAKYLGDGYKVLASGGHVRDLPANKLGVNVHNNFQPEYEIYPAKEATIKQLKREVANSDKVYLATDPDREGEAISWHLKSLLGVKDDNVRIVFNEITKKAVNKAIEKPSQIDMNLVDSQQARRVLDRLVGYMLSPVISRKIQSGLSAGRVQSVALRMIVDREREILAFKPEEFWNIFAEVAKTDEDNWYKSQFQDINGKKFKPTNKEDADRIISGSKSGDWRVDTVKRAKSISKPNPPFTTSTMQQDAVNKLNMSASEVMKVAQKLYEGVDIKGEGQHALVTYIRTDSVRISDDAVEMAKNYIAGVYGSEYYPSKPNKYVTKDNAQDAHEAIRPISLDRTPDSIKGKVLPNEYRLYRLVYNRFLASQMTNAEYDTMNIRIASKASHEEYGYGLKGKTMTFAGFTAVYQTIDDEDDDNKESNLPNLEENQLLKNKSVVGEQKFTKPPARYSDSSIIKAMEENGIGRPSTYASILSVLSKREYTGKDGKFLVPSDLGMLVVDQLVKYFSDIMDVNFTAGMENKLDTVAEGNVDWHDIIKDFYPNFLANIQQANDGEKVRIAPVETPFICDLCGKKLMIKQSKYGKFLGCDGYPDCKNVRSYEEYEYATNNNLDNIPPTPKCKECGATMVLKGKFYGCSNYPQCKSVLNINSDGSLVQNAANPISGDGTGPKCEKCGREMVVRVKGNNKFFACPGYPECKNIKPYTENVGKCPKCGGNIILEISYGKTKYHCDNCDLVTYNPPTDKICPDCDSVMVKVTKNGTDSVVCSSKHCGKILGEDDK